MGRPATEDFGLVVRTRDLSGASRRWNCARPATRAAISWGRSTPTRPRTSWTARCRPCCARACTTRTVRSWTRCTSTARSCRARCTGWASSAATATTCTASSATRTATSSACSATAADAYNTADHHFHKEVPRGKPSAGWLCVKCHMPEQPYMVVDWRADHSLRNPRPDLSAELGVPNACNDQPGCHGDKTVQWSVQAMRKWYGQRKRPHYGTVLAAGREGGPSARRVDPHRPGPTLPGRRPGHGVDSLQALPPGEVDRSPESGPRETRTPWCASPRSAP